MTKKLTTTFWIVLTTIPILGLIIGIADPRAYDGWKAVSQSYAAQLGLFAPVCFVIIQALQVIVTPISHYTVGLIGGFLFGPFYGGALNWLGRLIGHLCAFWISRHFGRPLVEKFVDPRTINRFDHFVSGDSRASLQALILFFIYFLPFFPDDEISYIVGLSKMNTRFFVLANIFGHVGGSFSLSYIGSGLDTNDTTFWVLLIATLVAFPALWIAFRVQARRREALDK